MLCCNISVNNMYCVSIFECLWGEAAAKRKKEGGGKSKRKKVKTEPGSAPVGNAPIETKEEDFIINCIIWNSHVWIVTGWIVTRNMVCYRFFHFDTLPYRVLQSTCAGWGMVQWWSLWYWSRWCQYAGRFQQCLGWAGWFQQCLGWGAVKSDVIWDSLAVGVATLWVLSKRWHNFQAHWIWPKFKR